MNTLKKDVSLLVSVSFFMKNNAPFASQIYFHSRRFVILDYSINDTEFTVKIDYDKETFGHLIVAYVRDMIKAIRNNQFLRNYDWMNDTVFVHEPETSDYFVSCVFLTVNSY